ncbi:CcdB family protein [Sphingomonas glacialis]|uniref:Toxin CcdB n=1 Tax=Sphingomonas glacialis TaxID=658225 RepID=A0A502FKI0_9SPHN|nr:CcdB family protein [Sphingomonas glacialis]TPG49762.1 plasmid maintenance protein CcdB [Sphingomonas glacialis]
MAQFDMFARRGGPGLLVDCQADALSRLSTRFVVPALPRDIVPAPVTHLNPVLEFENQRFVLLPQNAATVLLRELGQTVGSFAAHRFEIMNAIDMLLTGY